MLAFLSFLCFQYNKAKGEKREMKRMKDVVFSRLVD